MFVFSLFWGVFGLWIQTSLKRLLGLLYYVYTYLCYYTLQIMTALNLISVSARGLNIPHKRTTVLDFLHRENVDFDMIQESHLLCKDSGRLANKFYHPIATSSATTKCKGVMVLCKRKLKFDIIDSWADDADDDCQDTNGWEKNHTYFRLCP